MKHIDYRDVTRIRVSSVFVYWNETVFLLMFLFDTFILFSCCFQEIQSSLWIRPEKIVSGTGLRRNPTFSLTKPAGSDQDLIGFLAAGFQTGWHRKRSDRFLSNLTIGSYQIRPDFGLGKYRKEPDSGRNRSGFHRVLVPNPPSGLCRKSSHWSFQIFLSDHVGTTQMLCLSVTRRCQISANFDNEI